MNQVIKKGGKMEKPVIIGIAGGTASGKTTLATKIKEEFGENVIVLSHDFYYKSLTHLTKAEREQRNYDCPEAFETDLLISDIQKLIEGATIQRPIYSYTERLRQKETVEVKPAPIIVVEGILVLEKEALLDLMDIKIFVDTDSDIRLTRLIERDQKQRGLSLNYILAKYKDTLKPMHEKYVEPCKKKADIVVPANRDYNEVGFSIVIEKVRNLLKKA